MGWFLYDTASVMKKLKLKLFSYKNVSQTASKILITHCSFTDHLKHNIVNETICRIPSANSRQMLAHRLESFSSARLIFEAFRIY